MGDEFIDGMAICLDKYRELQTLDSNHELLKFGNVLPKDEEIFYLNREHTPEFDKRFAKDGVHPRGTNACAYALISYFCALRDAVDEKKGVRKPAESQLVSKAENPSGSDDRNIPF